MRISITIDDAHIEQISQVAQELQSIGLDIERTLPTIGVISGSIDSERVDALYQIAGVKHIEAEASYQLDPPDSNIQ